MGSLEREAEVMMEELARIPTWLIVAAVIVAILLLVSLAIAEINDRGGL